MQKILYFCDLCGKELRRNDVKKASFTVSPIGGMLALKEVCETCEKALNDALDKVIDERSNKSN